LRNNIDVIIAEHSYTGWLAGRLKKRTGKPFVIHSHNIESKRFQKMNKWWWRWYHTYERNIHRKADFNFFISHEDLEFAVSEFQLDRAKCDVVTYGVEEVYIEKDKNKLRRELGLHENRTILLFNGTLDYEPNYEAVNTIVDQLNPILQAKLENYLILITGNRAPKELAQKMLAANHVEYLGYVDDVNAYYQCVDLFINPVANDSGVKTKLIEAIANHCATVSTNSGASGIKKELCGDKLHLVKDGDWNVFTEEILSALARSTSETPADFFKEYSWKSITAKAAKRIEALLK
jgi:polysaccharide biosynthesis protein PslH